MSVESFSRTTRLCYTVFKRGPFEGSLPERTDRTDNLCLVRNGTWTKRVHAHEPHSLSASRGAQDCLVISGTTSGHAQLIKCDITHKPSNVDRPRKATSEQLPRGISVYSASLEMGDRAGRVCFLGFGASHEVWEGKRRCTVASCTVD